MGKTLYEKIWDAHLVHEEPGKASVLYIDRQLVHEVTSPQAFEGLTLTNRQIRRKEKMMATMDHCVPTRNRDEIKDPIAKIQVDKLQENCDATGVTLFNMHNPNQGVVHVVAPEQGYTLPGMTIVCGDSHTATHGAFGALAFGIGTSEVEHVMATQTLQQKRSKTMKVHFEGALPKGSYAKDMTLAVIGKIGTAGGTGYVIEYTGKAVEDLTMEGRMTLCNMAIEAGARAGMVACDDKTIEYLKDKPNAPKGADWDKAEAYWKTLSSDADAQFDTVITIQSEDVVPQVTWGTSPGQVTGIDKMIPAPADFPAEADKISCQGALDYMAIQGGTSLKDVSIDYVFIGSCTNGRLEDFREAASIVKGKKVNANVTAIAVPGSGPVKRAAEAEGLDQVFRDAGFEWREPGCSMCLAMNDDVLEPGQRCASTSNRNFEGRQGKGSRTHLVSPAMAAAAAVEGKFVDIRDWQ